MVRRLPACQAVSGRSWRPHREVNVDEDAEAAELVIRVNDGKRKIPTIEVEGRYFNCNPFDPYKLSEELNIPLNS